MNKNLVNRAIQLSEQWHHGQRRYDGSEFILHPRRMADKLAGHGYDDTITQCQAHLHDTVEIILAKSAALARMDIIYNIFGQEIGSGIFILSENMGEVGESIAVKTDAYKKRLSDAREDIQRVKVVDFWDNSTDLHVYTLANRIKRIYEADNYYIPMALKVAPTIAKELIEIIELAKNKYL